MTAEVAGKTEDTEGGGGRKERNRRTFLGFLLAAGAALAAPAMPLLRRLLPRRWAEAVRELDLAEVRKPGRWAG